MSDRDISNWDNRLLKHVHKKWDNYTRHRIFLDTAKDREYIPIAGEYLYVEEVSGGSVDASIRLDKNDAPLLDLVRGVEIRTVFEGFYITSPAQPGQWLDLLVGINFLYKKPSAAGRDYAEVNPVVNVTNGSADTDTQPAAQSCSRVLIRADTFNAGCVWVDFFQAAVQDSCIPLECGDFITVNIGDLNDIHANFEIANEIIFLIYE